MHLCDNTSKNKEVQNLTTPLHFYNTLESAISFSLPVPEDAVAVILTGMSSCSMKFTKLVQLIFKTP